ncbi:type VI secretion system protein TssL, long form [Limobrevibacterium gyesilva]|uniref:Type VI secretion system protein TssL, long form n=1 Tax=Limobrevibacterium gyesilva TaxID=2991712 RepID=A0AA41YI39_9PROT|nr:type VI secretion system protein TssL, long form [Limobrevibacterium gyesilva]MCW3473909.1 type VI secretion system protein TssL, long form [Limobrevibacterium gyesilva]
MSDNPFSEPDDSDRTVIRPAPGGRRPAAPAPTPSAPPPATAAPVTGGAETIELGLSPLTAAAAPLLQLLARLRNTLSQPDSGDLRERSVRELRHFEQAARTAQIPMEQLRPAHYALCASLDDVVLNTPWGSQGAWAVNSLVSTFHQEVRSGERFFDLLGQMKQSPGTFLPVLELMYLCLSLGLQGRYRLSPRGMGELDKIREDLYALIVRQRQAAEPDLSIHWQGVQAPYKPSRGSVPIWVGGVLALAVIAALFAYFSTSLNGASDALFARMLATPPALMPQIARVAPVQPPPAPPAPPEPGTLDKLRTFLKPEIDQGLVTVVGTEATPLVRIKGRGMFGSGSATLEPRFVPLLQRIAAALNDEQGSVLVTGHTDNQPINSVKFPSNYHLSAARANAAKAVIAQGLKDPSRITAEGRADGEPLATNATPEGREENRRIEVMLRRQG